MRLDTRTLKKEVAVSPSTSPIVEVAFLEELIEESLGSLTLNPRELFGFLGSDPWVKEAFQAPQVVEGDLNAAASTDTSFQRQTLGNKLVQTGVLDIEKLEQLLEDYRPFAETQRFGEFLRLNLQVPPQIKCWICCSTPPCLMSRASTSGWVSAWWKWVASPPSNLIRPSICNAARAAGLVNC